MPRTRIDRLLFGLTFSLAVALCGRVQAQTTLDPILPDSFSSEMIYRYYQARSTAMADNALSQFPPQTLAAMPGTVRALLVKACLMPTTYAQPTVTSYGKVALDSCTVEKQLLKIADGIYSPALVYLPPLPKRRLRQPALRHPALLFLPGHGDLSLSEDIQNQCLSFAKRGYIVMLVQPFGQDERGENPLWNEFHDSQPAAYLLVAGESLCGRIMADHKAELSYLLSRKDVDAKHVGVTGLSMGGTHAFWLSALDSRLNTAVSVAAGRPYQPEWGIQPQGMCDLIIGAYQFGGMDMLLGLVAPHPLLVIWPDVAPPLTQEGVDLLHFGQISLEQAAAGYAMTQAQRDALVDYERQVYVRFGAGNRFSQIVVPGPHDYVTAFRQTAAGWFDRQMLGSSIPTPPEGVLNPISDNYDARNTLSFFPKGIRPQDFLSPTAYVQRQILALQRALPAAPLDSASWERLRSQLRSQVSSLLGADLSSPDMTVEAAGVEDMGPDHAIRLIIRPEPGVALPARLISSGVDVTPSGELHVFLNADGMSATVDSDARKSASDRGDWSLCVDLRGTGETRNRQEEGMGGSGMRDYDVAISALKLGETLAGYQVKDLLAAIAAAVPIASPITKVVVHADREMGLVAILAAGQSDTIQAVETTGLLASYSSSGGYGLPYAYNDADFAVVPIQTFGGYQSMLPCIPNMLRYADIPQLAALMAPRPLTLHASRLADDSLLSASAAEQTFAWTRAVYRLSGSTNSLQITD
jgi:hypothetical protein